MRTGFKFFAAAALLAGLAMAPQPAQAISYDIGWTGGSGYTMTGTFSFSDALIGTGPIDETQIDSMVIEVFQAGASQGIWDLLADGITANFNFNFDTTLESFILGGVSTGPAGQEWDTVPGTATGCGTVGFGSGSAAQAVCIGGSFVSASRILTPFTLTATRQVVAVPEPASLGLLGAGLAGLLFLRRRQQG